MASQAIPDVVISHWSTLIENFQASPLAFYKAVEEALLRRQIPETKNSRVDYREAGLLSANREYLRVKREKIIFDICAAPFGTGFFVSWWLAEDRLKLNPLIRAMILIAMLVVTGWMVFNYGLINGPFYLALLTLGGLAVAKALATDGSFDDDIIRALPIIGSLYMWLFKPSTYYRIDSMLMFQKAVHNAVLEVVDAMTAEKGIRALSEADRKPIMREFYGKAA